MKCGMSAFQTKDTGGAKTYDEGRLSANWAAEILY